MNCREFELNVLILVRDGEAPVDSRAEYLKHTGGCNKCAHRLTEEQVLVKGVRAVIQQVASENAPARLETLLREAYHDHFINASPRPSHPLPVVAGFVSTRLALACSAMILSISLLALFAFESRWIPSKHQPVIAAIPLVDSSPGKIIVDPGLVIARPVSKRRKLVRHREPVRPAAGVNEVVTEFFPLTDEDTDSIEITQVMRVELPGSAMIDVGLPVAEEELKKPITAEIALGEDGIARAIRFVRTADR
jgi:hypothetical protein